uniref:NS1 n=1 Tax=uncultured densovirus TaxID=748192 RepID=A0A7M4CBJ6_9VIRU|nr:NS1 [uncultured densovirus]
MNDDGDRAQLDGGPGGADEMDRKRCAEEGGGESGTVVEKRARLLLHVPRVPDDVGGGAERNKIIAPVFHKNHPGVDKPTQESEDLRSVRIFDILQRSTGRYISDVIECGDDGTANRVAEYISNGNDAYKRGLLLVSIDKTHLHIVHDCSYTTSQCRCTWLQKAEIVYGLRRRGRSQRGRPLSNKLSVSDIKNILFYFTQKGRRTVYIKVGGRVERVPDEMSTMAFQGSEGLEGLEGQGEQSTQNDDTELRRSGEQEADACARRSRRGCEAISEKRRSSKGNASVRRMEKIVTMCKNYPMSPVEGILNHPIWLKDEELKFLTGEDKEVKAALNNWTKQLCTWTIDDYNVLYSDETCKPIFSAGYGNVDNYYYGVEQSVDVLVELLNYQFNHDDEYVLAFITSLFDILERRVPKLNTIYIRSPPSSGKNYFFDCIKDYYINVGKMCRANKTNNFAFQDAEGRRLVMWNEPNYSPEFIEILKELLGGDATNVSVKYKNELPVYRTPVIILTNSSLSIERAPAFKDRMKVYLWQPAPYLADYNKKPHPLATFKLFQRYNLC